MDRRVTRFIAAAACITGALLAVSATSGCGQKGPLFLPQDKLEEIERKRDEKKPAKSGQLPGALHAVTDA